MMALDFMKTSHMGWKLTLHYLETCSLQAVYVHCLSDSVMFNMINSEIILQTTLHNSNLGESVCEYI